MTVDSRYVPRGAPPLPGKIGLNRVYCAVSGIKWYIADNLGFKYVAEINQIHPYFLDTNNLRATLKIERSQERNPEKLFNKDWQDVALGLESDFAIPRSDQILCKSVIAGIVLARLAALKLTHSKLTGRQTHDLNISLCKHTRRARLVWWATRLCTWPKDRHCPKLNLSTVWEDSDGNPFASKVRNQSLATYLQALIEDDDSKLPRLRGRSQASVTIYDQTVAARARQRRAEKPLNGQHVDWGIDKAIACIKTLKHKKIITKRQHTGMEAVLERWADYPISTREKLGHRLIELSNEPCLKQDHSTVLERVGLGFVTGEVAQVANAKDYSIAKTFLGEVVLESPREKRPSLMSYFPDKKDAG